jgi:hypothetical protein
MPKSPVLPSQPIVSPIEVAALRDKVQALEKKLEDQKAYFEGQIAALTKQRDALERENQILRGARPMPNKAITKRSSP